MSTDSTDTSDEQTDGSVSRRDFVKAVGVIGGTSMATQANRDLDLEGLWSDPEHYVGTDFEDYDASDVVHTTCGQCNTFCPIKVRIADEGKQSGQYSALVRKLAGNPYSFLNTQPFAQVPYSTDPDAIATGDLPGTGDVKASRWSLSGGRMCLKGQAGIQTAFDTYRVRKPMKRVGPRGSGEWKTVSWEQAIEEIVTGADDLGTPGLEELWAYAPENEVMADWEAVEDGSMAKADFDAKYEDVLIDTDHPDLGPKANQIVDVGGFRRNFIRTRLFKQGLGTMNSIHHAGTCGFSSVMGNVHSYGGLKKRQYPDIENTEYIIVWGTNPMIANKGPTWLAPKLTNAIQNGMRMDVVDPRLSKTAEKAEKWVPITPGADAALALGMARWIVEHDRFDRDYLQNPNGGAAGADDEPTWSDATHLVLVDEEGGPKATPADLGLAGTGSVVIDAVTGEPTPASDSDVGVLDVDTTVNGTHVRSAWSLYTDRVFEYTLEEYAEMAGLDVADIEELADEFTSHGKKAAILSYRGPAKHTNGFYNTRAIATLQHLIGNYDWKGGQMTPYAGYATMSGRYNLGKVPNGYTPWGISILRGGVKYEDTSFFEEDGYPAKRPWFEVVPPQINHELYGSAKDAYPYSVNALFIRPYSENHVMAVAGGDKIPEILTDQDAFRLVVSFDTVIGETSQYADFILPEPTYLERWENFGTYPNKRLADTKISQPVVKVVPDARPAEDVLIDVLKRMDMPGVGDDAIEDDEGNLWPLHQAEDFYLKLVANTAFATNPFPDYDADADDNDLGYPPGLSPEDFPRTEPAVPDASNEEIDVFRRSHEKGLGGHFDMARWKQAVRDEEWRKVVTVLNRGGRFEEPIPNYEEAFAEHGFDYDYAGRYNPSNAYLGDHMRYQLGSEVYFYAANVANGKHSYTGERFDPLPKVEDIVHYDGTVQAPVVSKTTTERPLRFINWKPRTQGMHRTMNSPWLRETRPENPVWLNPTDADERGIENGDDISIDAGRRTVEGVAMVTDGIRPGVVGAMWGWGRTGDGATATTIDGDRQTAVERDGHTPYEFDTPMQDEAGLAKGRDAGFAVNHIQPLDRVLKDVGLSDPVGGSNAQYDAYVEVTKR